MAAVLKCRKLGFVIISTFIVTVFFSLTTKRLSLRFLPPDARENMVDVSMVTSIPSTPKVFTQTQKHVTTQTTTPDVQCTKKLTVAFLKVHKAGSTTVMNMFLRFAIRNNLNIVLPRNSSGYGFNYLNYGKTLDKSKIVPLPANETYSILCNHVIYSKESFDSVMPPGSVYVGIIREPKSHFISAAVYYGFAKHLRKFYSMTNASYSEILDKFLMEDSPYASLPMFYVHNRQSFDFGLPKASFGDLYAVENYIRKLDSEFQLVMLMEYFDESLIMLKRLLCWDTKDIIYVPLNVNKKARQEHIHLSSVAEEYLFRFNYADFRLYDYFKLRFMQKLKSYGQDLRDEVNMYKDLRIRTTRYCFSPIKQNLYIPATRWNKPFNVTKQDCYEMTMHELTMVHRLIDAANERYNDWKMHYMNDVIKEK